MSETGNARATDAARRGGPASLRGRLADFAMLAMVSVVVVLMIVPLRQWVLDLLIGVNLAISLTVFSMALFIRRPLSFSVFPTILLMATLYRLALNIASTRLILTEADAGRIIGAFGGYVVGADLLVGAVIFGILAMVLFLVITKGAQRVAEVAARFTLDALPGMQLAIEADLRAGAISPTEISRRRRELERTSHYYGSLDGAMKFVRGDAIAALVIIAVNIVGGVAVGTLRHGMGVGEALETYGRLTVGDGLVTMIPALLVSTAAGFLLTRVGQGNAGERLGVQVSSQLASEPKALLSAGAVMLVMAAVPALPAWPFLLLGGAMIVGGLAAFRASLRGAPGSGSRTVASSGTPGLDETQALIDELSRTKPVLVRETVPARIGLPGLADILGHAARDGIGREHLPAILEAVARMEAVEDAADGWELARKMMPEVITEVVAGKKNRLDVVILSRDVEDVLVGGVVMTHVGRKIALPEDVSGSILEAIDRATDGMEQPVLLVSPLTRAPLARWLEMSRPDVAVVAHGELVPRLNVEVLSSITV